MLSVIKESDEESAKILAVSKLREAYMAVCDLILDCDTDEMQAQVEALATQILDVKSAVASLRI